MSWSALAATAQDIPRIELNPPILVIDQDRLFLETRVGSAALAELEERAAALVAENQEIQRELIEREQELTDIRPNMAPEEFSDLADAFDERVERIRAEQDEKERVLNLAREEVRQDFFQENGGIISDIVRERGAVVLIDRRAVILSAETIDITDEAIARINRSAN